jgi:UDP-glucose 4-epimerase
MSLAFPSVKLLVTGGAGYIGSVVAARLLEGGHEVVVLDDLSTGHADAVPESARLVVAGIADDVTVREILSDGVEAVLHFAAKSLVGESETIPERYFANNVAGTLALLESMLATGVHRLVFSSSCAVYGQPAELGPVSEATPVNPTSAYGASKVSADLLISAFTRAHDFGAVSLRYFNAAGAYGRFGERHTTETHLIPLALRALTDPDAVLRIMGTDYPTPDGTAIRDYIHVLDLADAHLRALGALAPRRHAIYNLGSGLGSSVRDIVHAIAEVTGNAPSTAETGRRPGDPPQLVAANSKIKQELSWSPERPLAEIIRDAWAFTQRPAEAPDRRS